MRTLYAALAFLLILSTPSLSQAQLNTQRIETEVFTPKRYDPNYRYWETDFSESSIRKEFSGINIDQIQSITLVYTQFKATERFDQLALNTQRIDKLLKILPELKRRADIKWYWVAQTGCSSPSECRDLFHGFEIALKSTEFMSKALVDSNMVEYYVSKYLGKALDTRELDSLVTEGKLVKVCDTTYHVAHFSNSRYGRMRPVSKKSPKKALQQLKKENIEATELEIVVNNRRKSKEVNGLPADQAAAARRIFNKHYKFTTARYHDENIPSKYVISINRSKRGLENKLMTRVIPLTTDYRPIDSFFVKTHTEQKVYCEYVDTSNGRTNQIDEIVVLKTLQRNPEWANALVVTDVTGSMSPYIGQFLAWHQLHLKHNATSSFVFFNDGDNMRDDLKVVGQVGGTYYIKTDNYAELKTLAYEAMRNGNGGDAEENNYEAVLYGLQKNKGAENIIMIADNQATPRDLELLNKIKMPVHIILCGTSGGVNVAYLNAARKNNGTVHTMEEDLNDLAEVSEGHTLEIGNQVFIVKDGEFQEVTTAEKVTRD
jgi:hypothetical protein